MESSVAFVAVPRPVDQFFQYSVPPFLQKRVAVGQRVKIPFGRQTLQGTIVRLDVKSSIAKLLPILEVAEHSPPVSPELMALSEWVSSYYCAYPGLTLKALFPPGDSNPRTRLAYELNISRDQAGRELLRLGSSPKQAEILRLLINGDATPYFPRDRDRSACRALVAKSILRQIESESARIPYRESAGDSFRPELTPEQQSVVDTLIRSIDRNTFVPHLLFGVTGSGKTEVYLRALEYLLRSGKEGLLIVPEISLTPQMIQRVRGRFGNRAGIIHSGLSSGERGDAWRKIASGELSVVVGVRSAVFAPFRKLGMIIVDEEHDPAYKQENDVRYHARDTALVRAKKGGAVVILGSATPSLESYYNSQTGKSELLLLSRRVLGKPLPAVRIVNLKTTPPLGADGGISQPLYDAIGERMRKREQVLLFLNRRGFSPFLLCYDCGFILRCRHCSVSMTFHKKSARFHCHYCERTLPPLSSCPECQGVHIAYLGRGTEKIEEELQHLFPEARISRMDRDTTGRKFSYDRILGGMREGTIDILIGTQMVTKGHDLPNVTLVGVICADTILNFPDFRAAERTFQILTQVSGRAGRGEQEGEVIIQTYNPDHYSLVHAAAQDFPGFYQQEMKFRKELGYPPFTRLVTFLFSGRNESKVEAKAAEWVREIGLRKDPSIEILGPAPAPFVKIKGRYRWRCLIKGGDARKIGELTRKIAASWHAGKKEGVELEIDVDPQNLL